LDEPAASRGHVPLFQVDAFTTEPFRGNPAAVCLLDEPRGDAWMQSVAAEMNLSETAFVQGRADGDFDLRWFTPRTEVDLCGHATLASAHALWEAGRLGPTQAARFHTRSGPLTAAREDDWISLDFPAYTHVPASPPPGLAEALGVEVGTIALTKLGAIVTLESESAVRDLGPDFARIAALPLDSVTVTGESGASEFDFVSRFFAPRLGIDEDPVTGASHCALAPLWGPRLEKTEMIGYQASARGGVVRVRWQGERVALGGQAVTVMRAEML
jgi:PhzF family phenazine biosynthesis protein